MYTRKKHYRKWYQHPTPSSYSVVPLAQLLCRSGWLHVFFSIFWANDFIADQQIWTVWGHRCFHFHAKTKIFRYQYQYSEKMISIIHRGLDGFFIDHPTLQFPTSLSDRKWKVKISFWFKLQRLLLHSGQIWYCLPIIAVSEARNWSANKTQTFDRTVDVAGSCSAIFSSNIDIPCECRWHPFNCCSSNKYEFIKNLWKGI